MQSVSVHPVPRQHRVLLGAPDPAVRASLRQALGRDGFWVEEVAHARDVLRTLGESAYDPSNEPPAAIVVDSDLRGGGVRLARALRDSRWGIPVVLLGCDGGSSVRSHPLVAIRERSASPEGLVAEVRRLIRRAPWERQREAS